MQTYILTMDGIPVTELTKWEASNIKAEFPEIKSCIDIDILPHRKKFYISCEQNTVMRKKAKHDGRGVYNALVKIMENRRPQCSFANYLIEAGYAERVRNGHYILTNNGRVRIKIYENFNNKKNLYEGAAYIKAHPGTNVKRFSYDSHFTIRTAHNIFNKLASMGLVVVGDRCPKSFYWVGDDSLFEIGKEGD